MGKFKYLSQLEFSLIYTFLKLALYTMGYYKYTGIYTNADSKCILS